MASDNFTGRKDDRDASSGRGGAGGSSADKPDWADGLKQLYDSVVEEPLPDSFRDLLDQLDDTDGRDQGGSS